MVLLQTPVKKDHKKSTPPYVMYFKRTIACEKL